MGVVVWAKSCISRFVRLVWLARIQTVLHTFPWSDCFALLVIALAWPHTARGWDWGWVANRAATFLGQSLERQLGTSKAK